MRQIIRTCALAALAVMASAAFASAQSGFYYGIGLGFSSADSLPGPGASSASESSGNIGSIVATLGSRFERGGMFYGAEANADISVTGDLEFNGVTCSDGSAATTYFCDPTAVVRLRGILGTNSIGSGYEVFGSLGYAIMYGDGAVGFNGATDSGSVGGLTFGIGVQRQTSSGALIRAEVIRDDLDSSISMPGGIFEPTWKATSFSLSYIMGF